MGWLFSHQSRADLVAHLKNPARFTAAQLIASRVIGSRHWHIVERSDGFRFIRLDLIECAKGEAGYKTLDETMGPCFYDCPLSFLDLAPAGDHLGQYSEGWRAKVREFHAKKASKIAGNRVTYGGREYTLISALGRKGWIVRDSIGNEYRMKCHQVNQATNI